MKCPAEKQGAGDVSFSFDLDERGVHIMKRLVLAILLVLSLAVAADAQTYRGAINGTVMDPSGGSAECPSESQRKVHGNRARDGLHQ
jgi:hypothetical protein